MFSDQHSVNGNRYLVFGRPVTPSHLFWLMVIGYVLLGLVYSWATPPLESSDEYKHFPVVQYIQQTGELVVLDPDHVGKWKQEGAQPPLYYLLMAAATSWVDTTDLDQVHIENRHAFIGNAAQIKNKNLLFHDPEAERFPWSGSILAVYVIRLLSIGLGVGTLWFGRQTGRLLLNESGALVVVALTAFNPMFLFISAAVNNDSLSVLLGAAGLYLLVKIWQSYGKVGWGAYVSLGIVCGLGMLTKLSLATLLLLAGLVTARGMFFAFSQQERLEKGVSKFFRPEIIRQAGYGLVTLAVALGAAAPWMVRNLRLYGDLTGLNAFIAVQGTRPNPTIGGVDWLAEFGTFFRSFWGLFGGVNVFAPQWFYTVCNLLFLIGLVGLLLKFVKDPWFFRKSQESSLILPLLLVLITMFLLIRWTIISPAFQGRLLFPALIGVNVLWVMGLQVVSGPLLVVGGRFSSIPFLSSLFFLVMATLIPFTHIAPAYAFPESVGVPEGAEFGPITYVDENGESISLVGVELEAGQSAVPNDHRGVVVTLFWTTETGVSTDYVTAVHALGRKLESVGSVNRHPGWGMWPPTRWRPGEIYADTYHVWVNLDSEAPSLLQLDVNVLDTSGSKNRLLTPISPDGDELDLVLVGEAKLAIEAIAPTVLGETAPIDFADFVTLETLMLNGDLTAGSELNIDLYWRANGTPSKDYTVFAQLLDSSGNQIFNEDGIQVSGDEPPLNGYYPTRLWEAGELIADRKVIEIPADVMPGSYQVWIGMYDPLSPTYEKMQRLDGGDTVVQEIEIR